LPARGWLGESSIMTLSVPVRPATAGDADAICDIYAPIVRETTISFEAEPPGPAEIQRRMMAGQLRLPWLVAEVAQQVAGYAYATPFRSRHAYRWSVETSVYIAAPARRCGAGRALYVRLLAELYALGYVSAYAGIALPNDASVRLHETAGFARIGTFPAAGYKHGRWVDVGWWATGLRRAPAVPAPPLPWCP
jgi:L-amino acid N-acyltransferase YncA